MTRRIVVAVLCCALWVSSIRAQQAPKSTLVERVEDTGFIQLQSPSFAQLDEKQKAVAYWLTQAAIAIDPIIYDQLSRFGLRQKRVLEGIVAHHDAVPGATFSKMRSYALLFWANRGNHNETTGQKIMPAFTFEELQDAALKAQAAGAFKTPSGDLPALGSADAVTKELAELRPSIFDAAFEPITTAKTPPPGKDILQASSNNFYEGVSLADLKGFQEAYPLNSRLVKDAKGLHEDVYRAGSADGKIPPGRYATYLRKANGFEVTDRINVQLGNAAFLSDAADNNLSYICAEILADSIVLDNELSEGELVEIDGNEILIAISKI